MSKKKPTPGGRARKKAEVSLVRSSAAEYLTFVAAGGDSEASVEMRYEDENVWLTQKMMATLYDVSVPAINQHLKRLISDNELEPEATVKKYLIVQTEGSRQVERSVEHYSLQAIIAVGFKIENERAVQFRKWANQIVKDYTIQGWTLDAERLKHGVTVKAGHNYQKRDRLTRAKRWEIQEAEETYQKTQLDRSVVVTDQIRTVIRTFREKLFTKIFTDRPARAKAMGLDEPWVPKTLIFAKDDSHAEDIVDIVRKEFGKGNDFCKKVTYRASGKSEDIIKAFRTAPEFRIAVTVDMIATGTDIKPLECLLFLRDVRSQLYFEQMKGRGTRTIDPDALASVTPDAGGKTRFVLVDAVGVTESDKTDSRPMESKPSVAFDKLRLGIAMGARDEATHTTVATLANRIAA